MKILFTILAWGWTLALCALTPWPQPPELDPYSSQAVLLSQDQVLCAASAPRGLFLMRREGAKEGWFKVLDFDAGTTLREMDACPSPGGFTAALLLAGPRSTLLTLLQVSGDRPPEQTPVRAVPGELFPRNLCLLPEGDGGAVLLFVISKSDHRDTILKNSWNKLYAMRVREGRVIYDQEIGDEDAVNGGSFAAFLDPGGLVGIVRQRYSLGELQVFTTRIGDDGRTTRGKSILSMRPAARRKDCLLTLDAAPDGSEVRALLTEPEKSHFYRVAPDGDIRQRVDFDRPFVFLGYDPQGPSLLAADTRSPALHWLTFPGDRPCDEAFEFPGGIVRLRQPPGSCRWWMETPKGGTALRKYCQKGCLRAD